MLLSSHKLWVFSSLGLSGTGCKGVEKFPEDAVHHVEQEILDSMPNKTKQSKTQLQNQKAYTGMMSEALRYSSKTHFTHNFFPFFVAPCKHVEFPVQGSDLSHSCNLSHRCSHAGSLTHCAGLGIQPAHPSASKTPLIPLHQCGNSSFHIY